ncbi:MAG: ArsC/Spx/MgsR family protein [Acetobacteraceae bacterium]|jgi:nitrogenase-associated protein
MARVTFWGKPGCVGNARQLALLRASGHDVEVRDLCAELWTVARLRPFFGEEPVASWFNRGAPKVKRGELRLESLSEAEALAALIAEPLLIRRPLLEAEGRVAAGFNAARIAAWIGLTDGMAMVGEGCPRPEMPPCP